MKAIYLGMNRRSLLVLALSASVFTIVSAGAAHAWNFSVPAIEVKPTNGAFVFPASSLADGKAKHFVYKHSPSEWVRFFVVKSSDDVIRAAFDACDVCWRQKKGYVQQGNMMICVNCGLKFPTTKINEVKGGCNPAPLRRSVKGDKLVISANDVLAGRRYFR